MIEKHEFKGEHDGLSLLVLAAVHGNETAGTQACRRIIDEIERGALALKNGKMTLVPVCNPEAYRRDVRNIDENLNRVMTVHDNPRSYEQKLANEICPLIREHRFTLDLHSTHCVGDVPFAFCDYPDVYNQKLIDALPWILFWKAGRTFTAGRPKSAIFPPNGAPMRTAIRPRLWSAAITGIRRRPDWLTGRS